MYRRVLGAGLAAAVGIASCGSPETRHENVSVTGWATVQDVDVMTSAWRSYEEEESKPEEVELRNVEEYEVRDGSTCYAYDEDFSCVLSIANYKTVYDYDALEPIVLRACNVVEPSFQVPADDEVQTDADCLRGRKDGQWYERDAIRFVVRVAIKDDEKNYECAVNVPEDLFRQTVEAPEGLYAIERRGQCSVQEVGYPG